MTLVVFIAGPPGSGKSTLGDALATSLHGVHLDFDVVSAGVVDAARTAHHGSPVAELLVRVKDERYAALRAALVAHLVRAPEGPAVVSAPFTRQVADGRAWQPWAELTPNWLLVWLDLDVTERAGRIAARGAPRDVGVALAPSASPGVAHLRLDASAPQTTLVAAICQALDRGKG
jgi:shikimate kinase